MVIEKVHGLHATSISMNERFTILATEPQPRAPMRQKRRASFNNFVSQNLNVNNRNLIEQIARKLEQQAKRSSLRQRLGVRRGEFRRFGSESNLEGLQRSNSFGNVSQARSVNSRLDWRWSNGNLSRSASFGNLSTGSWGGRPLRGYLRRGGGQRALRGRFRGGRQSVGRVTRVSQRVRRGVNAGRGQAARGQTARGQTVRGRGTGVQAGRGQAGRGQAARGRGRGGVVRSLPKKPVFTKEELDVQLEQYMAGTKAALDRELDVYMKNALEMQ